LQFQYGFNRTDGYSFVYDNGHDYVLAPLGFSVGGPSRDLIPDCVNAAYGRLQAQFGDTSQWANNLLEARQGIGMIETRALQLAKAARQLRRLDFGGVAKTLVGLGGNVRKGFKPKAKAFGDQWLEYHFGWEPAVQDIHNACQTMSKADFGERRLGSSHSMRDVLPVQRVDGGSVANPYVSVMSQTNSFQVKMGCSVRISNPNAYLANQFGLINPFSIAWEAVPFSFVADWFGNVGQCLSACTDQVGLELLHAYTTSSTETTVGYFASYSHPNPNIGGSGNYRAKSFKVQRFPGIAAPTLRLKPFKGFSLTRGVTAISLLLQQLR